MQLEPEVLDAYNHTISKFEDLEYRPFRHCLTLREILDAHYLIVNHFYLEGSGLFLGGPKEENSLQSTVARQYVGFGNEYKWTKEIDVCATLFFGMIKNHSFNDANKRTSFLCALFQMKKCGFYPSIPENDFADFTVAIADNKLDRFKRYREFKKESEDPEVRYISWYLQKNFRKIDNKSRVITYRQLNTILHRYGYSLENPQNNKIEVIKNTNFSGFLGIKEGLFGLGKARQNKTRMTTISFPRWTAQVPQQHVKKLRDTLGLTTYEGVDSASFYDGIQPLQELITIYDAPLKILADR